MSLCGTNSPHTRSRPGSTPQHWTANDSSAPCSTIGALRTVCTRCAETIRCERPHTGACALPPIALRAPTRRVPRSAPRLWSESISPAPRLGRCSTPSCGSSGYPRPGHPRSMAGSSRRRPSYTGVGKDGVQEKSVRHRRTSPRKWKLHETSSPWAPTFAHHRVRAEFPDITSEYPRPLTGPVGKVLSDDMQFCFSVEVASGKCVAVIGPSGAGKSTLLALIGGIVRPVGAANRLGSVRRAPSGRRSSARSRSVK